MQDQHFAPDALGIGRGRRIQPAVEAHHAGDVGAAASKFQHAGAVNAKTVEESLSPYRRVRDEIRAFVETLPNAFTNKRKFHPFLTES
jgi:hypothetical protein